MTDWQWSRKKIQPLFDLIPYLMLIGYEVGNERHSGERHSPHTIIHPISGEASESGVLALMVVVTFDVFEEFQRGVDGRAVCGANCLSSA